MPDIESITVIHSQRKTKCTCVFAKTEYTDGTKLWCKGSGRTFLHACDQCTNEIFFTSIHRNLLQL